MTGTWASPTLRGDDHVNNTPRQINILRALGAALPEYGHVPMILGPDGEKLSSATARSTSWNTTTRATCPRP